MSEPTLCNISLGRYFTDYKHFGSFGKHICTNRKQKQDIKFVYEAYSKPSTYETLLEMLIQFLSPFLFW